MSLRRAATRAFLWCVYWLARAVIAVIDFLLRLVLRWQERGAV